MDGEEIEGEGERVPTDLDGTEIAVLQAPTHTTNTPRLILSKMEQRNVYNDFF